MFPSALFFDFDGVVLESVSVKTEAFGRLFEDRGPAVRDAVVRYHLEHGGISRYDKFRYYYRHLLREPLPDATFERLCRDFERLVYEGVLAAPFVPGAREFLEAYAGTVPCFVVSGTPHGEIRRIVTARGLDRFFVSVHGAPTSKGEWVGALLEQHGLAPRDTAFIGDARSDCRAAEEHGVPFVGRVKPGDPNLFTACACAAVVPDLSSLPAVLEGLVPASPERRPRPEP